jgi:transposase-like protein
MTNRPIGTGVETPKPSAERNAVTSGRHFDQEIIVYCVRWYVTVKLSSRDLAQMMTERGITLTHTTILRWVLAIGRLEPA